MAARQKKLEKHRRRRQEKQRQTRVAANHRIADYLSDRHEVYACYANEDWREAGMASIFVARRISPGTLSFAGFLVDYWGMGLKDAFGEMMITLSEFEERVERMRSHMGAVPIDLKTVQHLVFGGIAVAQKLGFRLPNRHERWTRLLGALPPGESPDMSLFGKNGKTYIGCSEKDLLARYLGDPKKLLERPDVEFTVGVNLPSPMDNADDEAEGAESEYAPDYTDLEDLTYDWCESIGVDPHPLVYPVAKAMTIETDKAMSELPEMEQEIHHDGRMYDDILLRIRGKMHAMGYNEEDVSAAFAQILGALLAHQELEDAEE